MPSALEQDTPVLRILHFNDVYNIAAGRHEPVGGASRFVTALREARNRVAESNSAMTTLTAFSGDAFSPSPLTERTDGAEIPPVLNAALVDVACIGNHDMDRGVDVMYKRISETRFPWLLSNASFKVISSPGFQSYGVELHRWRVIERAGVRFGFMGLIPEQWIDSLARVPRSEVEYEDFVDVANELASYLRSAHSVDVVIALTHMRQKDDVVLAKKAKDIDLILGGHDHSVDISTVNGRWIVKSGTDFRTFGCIDLMRTANGAFRICKPEIMEVTLKITQDISMCRLIKSYSHLFFKDEKLKIAESAVNLDGRFCAIRSRETGLGNLMVDILTEFTDADLGMLNGGSFRSDRVHPAGEFTDKDLSEILPYVDQIVVLDLTGSELLEGLENSVSQYPALEGRFCQVSNVQFEFDPKKRSGSRVEPKSVIIGGKHLKLNSRYKCVVKNFMARGKDGFDCFARREEAIIRRSKEGEELTNVIRRYFDRLKEDSADNTARISPKIEGRIVCLAPDDHLERICTAH